ncbi:adhesin [Pseudomonas laurentiana]|nr:adhesin [Pseudomonas laurentiana]
MPFAFVAAAFSVQAVASPINHTIQLEAVVPTADFYVIPNDSSWIGNTQVLSYNPVNGELSSLVKQFDVLHTAGSIEGALLAPAVLTSATDNIQLTVKFNNKTLTTTAQEVVSETQAAAPSVVNFEIAPVKPAAGGYKPGVYTGNVQLTFDAKI